MDVGYAENGSQIGLSWIELDPGGHTWSKSI